jgi:hypothetical protein
MAGHSDKLMVDLLIAMIDFLNIKVGQPHLIENAFIGGTLIKFLLLHVISRVFTCSITTLSGSLAFGAMTDNCVLLLCILYFSICTRNGNMELLMKQ